jgi:alpha-L-fucosidase
MLVSLIFTSSLVFAQWYKPPVENLKAREWFQDAKFGLFIHWGVYSVLEDGEWVMNNRKITVEEYEKLPARFNPVNYSPAEWVSLAKAAGMKYITITSKHHDGFAMFDSKVSDWNIVARTPYKKDPLKMLAEECRKQGVKLFFYHSQLDWHNPDYYPRGRTGLTAGRPDRGDWYHYLDYMDAQLRELLTNYGEIGGIWFDGWWDKPKADWRLQKTYGMIHQLQPQALVGANHHQAPFEGEDFQMFEKDLPGFNTAGFNQDSKVGALPLETCETINTAWGYNAKDKKFKSAKALVHYLVRAAGYNANFLLNVGPRPDGTIQPEFVERLKEVGAWLAQYGESIYGTRGGPIPPRDWGVTTKKGSRVFLHLLKLEDEVLALPKFAPVRSATLLKDGSKVELVENSLGLMLRVPMSVREPIDTVVVLETQ